MTDPQQILEELAVQPSVARDRLRSVADGSPIIAALKAAATDHAREILCDVLGFRHERAAVDDLISCLSDPSSGVRSSAADALAKIGDPRAGGVLFARLELPDPALPVQRMLAAALGAVRHHAAIPLLTELLRHPDPSLRGSSAWSLGVLRAQEAVSALRAAALVEQSPYPAQRMSEAIAMIDSVAAGDDG